MYFESINWCSKLRDPTLWGGTKHGEPSVPFVLLPTPILIDQSLTESVWKLSMQSVPNASVCSMCMLNVLKALVYEQFSRPERDNRKLYMHVR